jgi:UDP-galactopyranose mutase
MDIFELCDFLIVGAGLSGAVIAERIANILDKKVIVIEKRDHIAGNCYDYIDKDTGIRISKYGPHFFHTNDEGVWNYINRFASWIRWDHKVATSIDKKLIPLPVNINTINKMFDENLKDEAEMTEWMDKNREYIPKINNSEDVCLSKFGYEIYNKLFKPYTIKQWNKSPKELDPLVLSRIPIRYNFDDRYFTDKYQVLPEYGYTEFTKNLLESNNIITLLNTDFFDIKDYVNLSRTKIIFTGPIDAYFSDSGLPPLEYRSLHFETTKLFNTNFYQPFSVVNYPDSNIPYTRITEYKHLLNQNSPHTLIVKETSTDIGEPYYPIPNSINLELYEKYKELSYNEKNVYFVGRLANYKYFNMDGAIRNALDFFENSIVY